MKKVILTLLITCGAFHFGFAQASATHLVKIIANPILELSFDNSAQNTEFNFVTLADYDNGKTNLQAAGLRVRSNKNWVVNVKSNSPNFIPSSDGDTDIKSSSLLIRKAGTALNIPVGTFEQAIASGTNGGFDKNSFSVDYIANPGYIRPDSYSIEITYTLTTP